MKNTSSTILYASAIIGLSLIVGLWLHSYQNGKSQKLNTISITGSVKKLVTSDLAKWTTNFTKEANLTNIKSQMVKMDADSKIIKEFLIKEMGLNEKEITFLPVQTEPRYESSSQYVYSPTLIGYNIRQEVRAESSDLAKIEKLSQEAKKLIDKGIIPEYQRTEYLFTQLEKLRPTLFAEATKDAITKADAIVSSTGSKIGQLRSAKTGVIQIMQPNTMDISDYGQYDLSTKEKEISATVSVSFELINK